MHAFRIGLAVFLLFGVVGATAAPRGRTNAEDSPLAVAGLLVREGEWERASAALTALDTTTRGFDQVRFHTLVGLVALHDKRGVEAMAAFSAALGLATEGRELLQLHLARAALLAAQPEAAITALDAAGEVGASLPGTWLLRAQAEEARGRADAAFAALETGCARFPEQPELARQSVFLLVRLGLFRAARERGEALLSRAGADADDAIAIAEALRQGGDTRQAMTILEAALLRDGDNRDLLVQAARAALADQQPRNAGRFLERAARLDPALYLDAAEAYRRAGDLDAALRANGGVVEPAAKARQRLGLLLDGEDWERALALEERLLRLGLATDDGVAYGLAYAAFRLGDTRTAERWLRDITDPEVFRRGGELREAMAACGDEGCL